jgi:predicted PurR-regulated permease PerM
MRFERHVGFWVGVSLIFVGLLWLLSPVLLPFVAGIGIAYLLDPLARRLTRYGLSRPVAALMILGGFVLVIIGVLLLVGPILVRQFSGFISDFIGRVPNYVQHIQGWINDPSHPWLKRMLGSALGRSDQSIGNLVVPAASYLNGLVGSLLSGGRALVSLFSLAIISPVVAFYLICDWDRMLASIDGLIPLPDRETVRGLARDIDASISAYVHGQTVVCLSMGAYYAIGLTLAGLHFGLLIGVVAGIISFVPYVGSLTALVASLGVAVEQFYPHWGRIVIVAAVVLIGQFIEGYILSPRIVGKSVCLHPVWLIFALFAFGYLLGFVGLLLAVPLAAAAGVLVRFALQRYRESPIYTGSGSP